MIHRKSIIVVRPYHSAIRDRVYLLMDLLGYDPIAAAVIPTGIPDDMVLAALERTTPPEALLIPFHAHRDTSGRNVDGLALAERIWQIQGYRRCHVLMPVSQVAQAGFLLRVVKLDPLIASAILDVPERGLADVAELARTMRGRIPTQ